MPLSFDDLAAEIQERARALEAELSVRSPVSDEDWQSLSFKPFHLDVPGWAVRAWLNEMTGPEAAAFAYRAILHREPDSHGLETLQADLAKGVPVLLLAGHMMLSAEGRSLPRYEPGFLVYRVLAVLRKALRASGADGFAVWLARGVARVHRRWDADRLARMQFAALKNTLASWQPALIRQAGQLGAAQAQIRGLQLALGQAREELVEAGQALGQAREELAVAFHRFSVESQGLAQIVAHRAPVLQGQPFQWGAPPASGEPAKQGLPPQEALDRYYLAFEDAHRGDLSAMMARYAPYGPILEEVLHAFQPRPNSQSLSPPGARLLDLGCGRGEWLQFAQSKGFAAAGVDANPVMVAHCHGLGLSVASGDLMPALLSQPDGALAVVSAFHVAEHLPFGLLYGLVQQAYRCLGPGGAVILETPNPENPLVGSHTFYHDHTHRNPLTPTALQFLLRYLGFQRVRVLRLHPYPESHRVPGEDPLTERFNGLFCGPQDFAVIGFRQAG